MEAPEESRAGTSKLRPIKAASSVDLPCHPALKLEQAVGYVLGTAVLGLTERGGEHCYWILSQRWLCQDTPWERPGSGWEPSEVPSRRGKSKALHRVGVGCDSSTHGKRAKGEEWGPGLMGPHSVVLCGPGQVFFPL